MRSVFLLCRVAGFALALFGAVVPTAFAQVVSSGLTGVIRDASLSPIAGAKVSAIHHPTGTTYSATTGADGRYNFGGMVVGGPYTISVEAEGFKPGERAGVVTRLGAVDDAGFVLEAASGDVVQMEAFVVETAANDLNGAASGTGNLYGTAELSGKPTTSRSLADMVSAAPQVVLRAEVGDREEAQITAVGQNVRYNSIQIDGARINDQFGLNMTGLASFFNPLSLDTIEQLSVQVSPYDVRQAGFTGAAINAVTKSGTNQFRGSVYYMFSGDEWLGVRLQGENAVERVTQNRRVVPTLERQTKGFTLGGPIIPNRLFFFVNYEEFERVAAPGAAGMLSIDQGQATAILDRLAQYNTASGQDFDWGEFILGTNPTNTTSDEKKLAKLDWNITSNHRFSVRYSTTEGELPQFGKYTNFAVPNNASLSSNGATALSTHVYAQERREKVWAAQLFSQWTPRFRTEAKYSQTSQDQDTPLDIIAPEVAVFGITAVNGNGAAVNNGAVVFGTEFSRQGNQIFVDSKSFSLTGDYVMGDIVFSGGVEREESDYFNIFRNGSFGTIVFSSLANFLADQPARIERASYDPNLRPDAADISDFATTGVFGQAQWNVNSRLSLMGGVRVEFAESDSVPPLNQAFVNATGFRNDGTVDGVTTISPRFSFNYALDGDRTMQLRGGVGHFLGRAPWVIFSNSYNNPGVGSFTTINSSPAQGSMTAFLQAFDPENPIGTGADTGTNRRQVDWVDDKTKLPSVWRANLAFDKKLPFLDSTFTAEVVLTVNDDQLFIIHENLRPSTLPALDGRLRFSGNPFTAAANALYPAYTDLFRVTNTGVGSSRYVTLTWDRPLKNGWAFNTSYTNGDATEAQAFGQTTASGQWQRNAVFNQGVVEKGTSDFEVKHRFQATFTREFEFFKDAKTRVSLYYERRSGDPYSFVYRTDLNGDGGTNSATLNDLVSVPTDINDPRFNFTAMTQTQVDAYFDFMRVNGLMKYAGGFAPKNAFHNPYLNRLDLKLSQTIPLHFRDAKLELFMDFLNFGAFLNRDIFGYYWEAPNFHFGSRNFRRRFLGNATYDAQGRIVPTLNPDNFVVENGMSRWKIQLGARLTF